MSGLIGRDFGLSLVRYRKPLASLIARPSIDVNKRETSTQGDFPDSDGVRRIGGTSVRPDPAFRATPETIAGYQ